MRAGVASLMMLFGLGWLMWLGRRRGKKDSTLREDLWAAAFTVGIFFGLFFLAWVF